MPQYAPKAPTICRWVVNRALEFTELHEDLLSLFDLDPETTTPQNALMAFYEKVHPEDATTIHRFWTTSADLFPTSQKFRYLRRDGSTKWLRSILIMKLEDGSVLGTTHDISEARFQAKENETIKNQLERITKTSPSIIYVYDLDKKENTYANRSLFNVLGYSPEEVAELGNQLFPATLHPDDLPGVFSHHASVLPALKEGDSVKLEYRMKNKKTGTYVWLKSTEAPHSFDKNGRVISIIGIAEDITKEKEAINSAFQLTVDLNKKSTDLEKAQLLLRETEAIKKLNRKLRTSQKRLNAINQEMEEFVYITSHDLSEPLRTISNYLGLIMQEKQAFLDEEITDFLTRIQGANTRMQRVVKDLLSLSRIGEEGGAEPVVLREVFTEILEDLHQVIHESEAIVDIRTLPTIIGRHQDFKHIFQNLISNAIKYRKQGISPKIVVEAVEKRDHWIILVEDNGIGMNPKHAKKIFQPFQRLHLKSEYQGTGIGLAICKKMAERQGGKVWVETELEKGSVFFVKILKELN